MSMRSFPELSISGRGARVDLMYPRCEGNVESLTIGLCDVRAADDIKVRYDFERDGWSILQASKFSFHEDDVECDPDWQEVAFVRAWSREDLS